MLHVTDVKQRALQISTAAVFIRPFPNHQLLAAHPQYNHSIRPGWVANHRLNLDCPTCSTQGIATAKAVMA